MSDAANDNATHVPARPCPICGRAASAVDKPFCSRRCADVDLHRWLGGVYAVPAEPDPEAGLTDLDPDAF